MEERERTSNVARLSREVATVAPADFRRRGKRNACRQAEDLHICPACSSPLVQPIDWAPASGRRWLVKLRCPDCWWSGGGTYSQKVVDRFDEVLDEGTEAVLGDLEKVAKANMSEHVEAFVAALEADRILPEDF